MRINIELDEQLMKQALQLSKLRTKKDVIQVALTEYVASLKRKQILALRQKDTWEGDLNDMRNL